MAKVIVRTADAAGRAADGSYSYSQAVKAAGLVFVAGQGPFDPATGAIVGTTIQEQTGQCLRNVEAILRAAGSAMDRSCRRPSLRHPEGFARMNEEWGRWFPTDPPARQGAKHSLEMEGFRISIAVIAEA